MLFWNWDNEVSTTRLSGWVKHLTRELTTNPPADAGGTDLTSFHLGNHKLKFAAYLRLQPVQHPRKRNRLAHMLDPAHPRRAALNSHTEACVRHAAIAPQIQVPFEGFPGQAVRGDLLLEEFDRSRALATADHFAIALRREHIYPQRNFIAFRIALHIESFDGRRIMMNHHRLVVLTRQIRLVRRTQITAPLEFVFQ